MRDLVHKLVRLLKSLDELDYASKDYDAILSKIDVIRELISDHLHDTGVYAPDDILSSISTTYERGGLICADELIGEIPICSASYYHQWKFDQLKARGLAKDVNDILKYREMYQEFRQSLYEGTVNTNSIGQDMGSPALFMIKKPSIINAV